MLKGRSQQGQNSSHADGAQQERARLGAPRVRPSEGSRRGGSSTLAVRLGNLRFGKSEGSVARCEEACVLQMKGRLTS